MVLPCSCDIAPDGSVVLKDIYSRLAMERTILLIGDTVSFKTMVSRFAITTAILALDNDRLTD